LDYRGADRVRDYKLWTFGFPYYRGWEEIREFVTTTENNGFYATNENSSISIFYVPYRYYVERAGHYIYIHNPQSFRTRDTRDKVQYWRAKHKPVKVLETTAGGSGDLLHAGGSLEEIKSAGY